MKTSRRVLILGCIAVFTAQCKFFEVPEPDCLYESPFHKATICLGMSFDQLEKASYYLEDYPQIDEYAIGDFYKDAGIVKFLTDSILVFYGYTLLDDKLYSYHFGFSAEGKLNAIDSALALFPFEFKKREKKYHVQYYYVDTTHEIVYHLRVSNYWNSFISDRYWFPDSTLVISGGIAYLKDMPYLKGSAK